MKLIIILIFMSLTVFLMANDLTLSRSFKEADAASDRNAFLSNAQTLDAGEVTINDYWIFVLGLSVGVMDDLELSITAQPLDGGMIFTPVYLFSGKYKVVDTGKYIFSTQIFGLYSYYDDYDDTDNDGDTGVERRYNGAISFLFDYFLSDSLFLSFNLLLTPYHYFTDLDSAAYLNSNITFKATNLLKLFAEIGTGVVRDDSEVYYPLAFAVGLRLYGESFAFDVSAVGNLIEMEALPFFSFNFRF